MDVTGYTGQGTGGGRGKKERSSEQEYKDKSNCNLLGPQMRRLVVDACPPLRQKSLTLCCPLNTSVCDLGALCMCVCARVCSV